MKTAVLLLTISISTSIAANAQNEKGWQITLKAIPQASWMWNKSDKKIPGFDRKTLVNTGFGIGTGYNFSKRIGLGLDVLYSLQGQKYGEDGLEFSHRINYIKLPLALHYTINPSAKINLIGKVGPQLNILSEAKIKKDDQVFVKDAKEYLEDITFGGVAGLSVQIPLHRQWFLLTGLRYDLGFTNAENKDHKDSVPLRKKTYNSTAGIEVGLKYNVN